MASVLSEYAIRHLYTRDLRRARQTAEARVALTSLSESSEQATRTKDYGSVVALDIALRSIELWRKILEGVQE